MTFQTGIIKGEAAAESNKELRNILTIDVEDYFQVSAFEQIIARCQWDRFESRVERNTQKILELMAKRRVLATFFVLGWVAERFPRLVEAIHSLGHEIACHGYSHKLVYQQTPEEFLEETRRAKTVLEDIIGVTVVSYRAASYSITQKSSWALEILAKAGFKYDSSIFPIAHDRYGVPRASRHPFRFKLVDGLELIEFPMSTVRLFGTNLPVAGGGYFRLLPYPVTRAAIRRLHRIDHLPLNFYLHPWEFDPEQPRQPASRISRFRHYLNLHKTEARFQKLLEEFCFAPLSSVAPSLQYTDMNLSQLFGPCGA